MTDSLNVFILLVIAAIQYVPILRLEVSTPAIDLLLENLIIEPGKTVNRTCFRPYRLKIETYNDFEIRKARFRTNTSSKRLTPIKIDRLSARADEVGFWLRAHSRLFRLADEGIGSFALDERSIHVHLEVEICRERLEQILTLRGVRVRVHKLNYKLRKSKFAWLGWLIKPILRPILKATLEAQLATAITDLLHAGNRELLLCRRGMIDMRKRFRGNQPITFKTPETSDNSGEGDQLYAGRPAFSGSGRVTDGSEPEPRDWREVENEKYRAQEAAQQQQQQQQAKK